MGFMVIKIIILAFLVIVSGTYLSKYGDVISIKTGLGHALIGGVLMALATSMPELVSSITASLINAPDIAVGNVLGSNTFNLAILAIADLMHGPGPLMLKVKFNYILSGLLGSALSAFVAMAIIVYSLIEIDFSFGSLGVESIFILLIYCVGARLIYRYKKKRDYIIKEVQDEKENREELIEKNENKEEKLLLEEGNNEKNLIEDISLQKAVIGFFAASVVIFFSGYHLSVSGKELASLTGIDQNFIGSFLIAAATSLPELVATISAIRINAYNMAIGNVMGSNIFNMVIIVFADLFYLQGSILADVKIDNIVTALLGLMMSIVAIIGLFYRSRKTVFSIGWDSLIIGVLYFLGFYLLFSLGVSF